MKKRIELLVNNGIKLWQNENYIEAEHEFRQALDSAEEAYGPDAPELIEPLYWLSGAVAPPGDTEPSPRRTAAVDLKRRALRITETHFGGEDPRLIRILSNLATSLRILQKYEEAYDHLARALHISEKAHGEGGQTSNILRMYIDILLDLNRPAKALPFAERALRLEEPSTSELSSIGIGYACRALGRCFMGVGRNEEAIAYLERSLALFKVRHPSKKIIFEDEILGWIEELRKRP
jgi:tetratricopeptide (TPR) repeat protein